MIRNNYTGIGFKNHNVIVQKLHNPKEIKISISAKNVPSEEQVDNIVGYLGEEGFLDYDEEPISENTKLQVGYLPEIQIQSIRNNY